MTRQSRRSAVMFLVAISLSATAAASAYGANGTWYRSTTHCWVWQLGNSGWGLQTTFPVVYATNARRYYRDRQWVAVQYAINYSAGGSWVTYKYSRWWQGLAYDNSYVLAWWEQGTGTLKRQESDGLIWDMPYEGWYRVWQRVYWYPTSYVGAAMSPWTIVKHDSAFGGAYATSDGSACRVNVNG